MGSVNKVIIDTDCGVDDAMAILMLLKAHQEKKLEVIAITTVIGNTCIENVNKNALRILKLANMLHIPVYPGACKPYKREYEALTTTPWHGWDGFGDVGHTVETPSPSLLQKEKAASALVRLSKVGENERLYLVAIGPLTNLAAAFDEDPKYTSRYTGIYVMGGNAGETGNVPGCNSEYNFWYDPEAARLVLEKTQIPIHLSVMEDGREKVVMTNEERKEYGNIGTPTATFLNKVEAPITKKATGKYYLSHDQLSAFWMMDNTEDEKRQNPKFVIETETCSGSVCTSNDKQRGNLEITRTPDKDLFKNLILITKLNPNLYTEAFKSLFRHVF